MAEPLKYSTGEEIIKGDSVLYDEHPGFVEFVAFDVDDPEQSWYVRECGVGVMIKTADFGLVYSDGIEDLEFVARAE